MSNQPSRALEQCVVLVTPRSFGADDPALRRELEAAVGQVRYNDRGRPLKAVELQAEIAEVDGLLAGLDEIDAGVFAAAPRLRVVARYGTGTSNVDLRSAAEHGVVVTNTPDANTESVAELAIGLMFDLTRSISKADRAARAGRWKGAKGTEVAGKTVGLIGLGRIGRAVARRAEALGCAVIAYDPFADRAYAASHHIRLASLHEVVSEAHILSLHAPLTDQTRGIVNRELLSLAREGAFLVNTARGELVVEADLVWALDSGRLGGAALDAWREEPPSPDNPLLHREDVIVTPHIGAHTAEATAAMGRGALQDLLTVLAGRPPLHAVALRMENAP